MRILLVNGFRHYSGAESIVNSLYDQFRAMGHDVIFLAIDNIGTFSKTIEDFKPDVINQHNWAEIGPIALRYLYKLPFVQTVHDYWPVCQSRHHFKFGKDEICTEDTWDHCNDEGCPNYMSRMFAPARSREVFKKTTIVTVSNYCNYILKKYGYENVYTIHNGIELYNGEEDIVDLDFVLCTAKTPEQIKGPRFFAEMAEKLGQYQFILVGGAKFDVSNLKCVDALPREEMLKMMMKCSVFVMPSVWEEPNGLVLQEAMQFGKPVVAFGVGGIPEYVENFVVSNRDVYAACELIDFLMMNREKRNKYGRANMVKVFKEFQSKVMAQRYINLFAQEIDMFKDRERNGCAK